MKLKNALQNASAHLLVVVCIAVALAFSPVFVGGELIGSLAITYGLTRLVMWTVFRKNSGTPNAITISGGVTLSVATVVGGFGFSDDGDPLFFESFLRYLVPCLLVVVFELVRNWPRVPMPDKSGYQPVPEKVVDPDGVKSDE